MRFIHHPSGARGEARDTRSQLDNERLAFRRMAESPKMRAWLAEQALQAQLDKDSARQIRDRVDSMLRDVIVEVRGEDGEWHAESE